MTMTLVPAAPAAPGDGPAGAGRVGGIGPVFTDPARPVEVAAGETFRIVLDSNRTTGYGWQLAELPDEAVVKKVHSRYRAPRAARPGAGGQEVWRFQAQMPGTAEIRMVYVRSWEKGVPPARTAVFKVTVK
jgi:inhibitor of cysteine peptidase